MFFGLVFFTGGGIGILRFPDFYTRLHPAGKLDTLGSLLMMTAVALFNLQHVTVSNILTSIKIMLIVVFVFMSSPTATHAIMDDGARAGLRPWEKGVPKE
ncbi:MAG: sodium:proton antiporter [Deltaproteobacteria bacterium]|nr:MAG: sodium:proton antiporter [Deltaproteobacteria bacterium]